MKIVLATRNMGKVKEIKEILRGLDLDMLSLNDFPKVPSIIEDGKTFKENALKKARFVSRYLNIPALADDSGIEVDALDKRPGILSARYAGENAADDENNTKLLQELRGIPFGKRCAHYKCVIAIVFPSGEEETVDGSCNGFIALEPKGKGGFGYDPLFYVPEYGKTMAELPPDIKNRISHRGKALAKLKEKLTAILLSFMPSSQYLKKSHPSGNRGI
ncbi:MAG TPA: XTP/dITP diphosphatase [Thermodesulfobacteriota bacterium]|nr:XTP/dITP diphosphatase [Thermodesulfobacteriota bacterium]